MNYLLNILNLALAAGVIYFGATVFFPGKMDAPGSRSAQMHTVNGQAAGQAPAEPGSAGGGKQPSGVESSRSVTRRNLFNAELVRQDAASDQPAQDAQTEKLEPTRLKLELWGTVAVGKMFYAVIEDKTTRKQELYEAGDKVQEASVEEIHVRKVVLSHKGKRQVLEMNETPNARKQVSPFAVGKKSPQAKSVSRAALSKPGSPIPAPDNTAQRKQTPMIKFRPHISQGEMDGMMVYGIRPGSVFRSYGLRNGDVVQSVNQTAITTREEAQALFDDPESWEGASVTLVRRGTIRQIQIRKAEDESEDRRGEN